MTDSRDCKHGRRLGDCIVCENEELEQRNAELAAQVEKIKSAWVSHNFHEINKMIIATPAQCLAEHDREVAARAIEKSAQELASLVTAPAGMHMAAVIKLNLYANKIKSGEVEI